MTSMAADIELLESTLTAAVKRCHGLPAVERRAFVGRFLLETHEGKDPSATPSAFPLTVAEPDRAILRTELTMLASDISAALNAARGSTDGWPLKAVANILLRGSGSGSSSVAPPAAEAPEPPAEAPEKPGSPSAVSIADEPESEPPAAGPSRGGYGGLAKPKGGGGGYGALGGKNKPKGTELTYSEMEKRKASSRPQTLPPSALEKLDMFEVEDGAQSARAATSSWSLTGGTRDASFKKRSADFGTSSKGSVGFASVLSLSGWSEVDAEEVNVGSDPNRGSLSEREEGVIALSSASKSILAPPVALADASEGHAAEAEGGSFVKELFVKGGAEDESTSFKVKRRALT